MKKLVCGIITLLLACSVFAQKWGMTYDQILEDIKNNNVLVDEYTYDEIDFDSDFQNFTIGLWYTYFPDYAYKYGIPFVCGYVTAHNPSTTTAVCCPFTKGYDICYFSIIALDSGTDYNCASYVKKHLSTKNEWVVGEILHELIHVVENLNNEYLSDNYKSHDNLTWYREVKRLHDTYGVNVN